MLEAGGTMEEKRVRDWGKFLIPIALFITCDGVAPTHFPN